MKIKLFIGLALLAVCVLALGGFTVRRKRSTFARLSRSLRPVSASAPLVERGALTI